MNHPPIAGIDTDVGDRVAKSKDVAGLGIAHAGNFRAYLGLLAGRARKALAVGFERSLDKTGAVQTGARLGASVLVRSSFVTVGSCQDIGAVGGGCRAGNLCTGCNRQAKCCCCCKGTQGSSGDSAMPVSCGGSKHARPLSLGEVFGDAAQGYGVSIMIHKLQTETRLIRSAWNVGAQGSHYKVSKIGNLVMAVVTTISSAD